MSTIAFRCSSELERKLKTASRIEKKTKTDIILEALDAYLDGKSRPSRAHKSSRRPSTLETLKDVIGVWDGPVDGSINVGRGVGDYLLEKYRSRRV